MGLWIMDFTSIGRRGMMPPYISFVGYSNSGKTTLISRVIERLTEQGYRVGALKHDAHRFEMDREGKDTWKYRQAGAKNIMISSSEQVAQIEQIEEPIPFTELIGRFRHVDLVLVEGYKRELTCKILVARTLEQAALATELQGIAAVATTLETKAFPEGTKLYSLDDIDGITELVKELAGI
jgi:molybdopterin-guanine dinucleotide biosynthesis protein B